MASSLRCSTRMRVTGALGGLAIRPLVPLTGCRRLTGAGRTRLLVEARKTASAKTTVVPEPSFNVPLGLAAIAGFAAYEGVTPVAAVAGILAAFLAFQTTRVRFVFAPDDLEVVIAANPEKQTKNAFVGGANRWKYSTFTNWEFWWPNFPVLVYFKETQTKPEGQIHFFPIIFNGKQLYDVMVERCGNSMNSAPK